MARPIKETPVLTGTDAAKFRKNLELSRDKHISKEKYEKMKKNFEFFHSKSTF